MVASAQFTSWQFGTADLSLEYDVDFIISVVVNMTVGYVLATLFYILIDDGIKAHRLKKQVQGQVKQEKEFQMMTREILRDLAETQRLQQETEAEFGDPELVEQQLARIRGKKKTLPAPVFRRQFANTVETNPTEGGE